MNKKIFYLLMLVFTLGLSFTACSDDDDDDYVNDITAVYAGDFRIPDLLGSAVLPGEFGLFKAGKYTVRMALPELTLPINEVSPLSVSGIEMKNVPVTKVGNTYKLMKTTEDITVVLNGSINMPAKVTVEGTIVDGKMDLNINVEDIDIPNFNMTFTATRK